CKSKPPVDNLAVLARAHMCWRIAFLNKRLFAQALVRRRSMQTKSCRSASCEPATIGNSASLRECEADEIKWQSEEIGNEASGFYCNLNAEYPCRLRTR